VKMGQKIIFDDQTAIWYNIPATAAGVADVEVRSAIRDLNFQILEQN